MLRSKPKCPMCVTQDDTYGVKRVCVREKERVCVWTFAYRTTCIWFSKCSLDLWCYGRAFCTMHTKKNSQRNTIRFMRERHTANQPTLIRTSTLYAIYNVQAEHSSGNAFNTDSIWFYCKILAVSSIYYRNFYRPFFKILALLAKFYIDFGLHKKYKILKNCDEKTAPPIWMLSYFVTTWKIYYKKISKNSLYQYTNKSMQFRK